jgi:uncharacterized protein YbbC (DUF1343 family)/CubicO group peptidase (beta-lactamase class C family)
MGQGWDVFAEPSSFRNPGFSTERRYLLKVLSTGLFLLAIALLGRPAPAFSTSSQDLPPKSAEIREDRLASLSEIVEEAIRDGKTPGAVVLISHRGQVVYRRAFGHRAIEPKKLPMLPDTIFDLSSLTKVVATAPAIMQLVEKGKLRLEDPVAKYWPEFKAYGKDPITVNQLLTHYSGLPAGFPLKPKWTGTSSAMQKIIAEKPISIAGTQFLYSDLNFIVLGELVSRVSALPLNVYCQKNLFGPLGMKDTGFNLPDASASRFAFTQYKKRDSGEKLWGEVHDSTAFLMGGVAGHAGLFSTADDLSVFAQSLLNGGMSKGIQILSPLSVRKMSTPQNPPHKTVLRGLGWDIDSPFSSSRGELFPLGSYGHSGYTGTSIWIDPLSQTYVIILTNRVHPGGQGEVVSLRSQIATCVAAALSPVAAEPILSSGAPLTGSHELRKSAPDPGLRNGKVRTGIEVLAANQFAPLAKLRVGLITNHSGLDSRGRRTVDLLFKASKVSLVKLFTPEHGPLGLADGKVSSGVDSATGLPVQSLYGEVKRPSEKMLEGLDALIFDIQDAGARFYTYITTMAYALEAAAERGKSFYVLDRPNPINALSVQGPILDKDLKSFTGYFPMPVRHGMTVGELAQMFNTENQIGAKLHVIRMQGYQRTDWYDETGLMWINPSPNMGTLAQATLYPGVAMVEGANISVGRGTGAPFELLGAPWIDARELASYLNRRRIQGVRFAPVQFSPVKDRYENQLCRGVQIILVDRQALDSPAMGVEIAGALFTLYPQNFQLDKTLYSIGSQEVLNALKRRKDPQWIQLRWQAPLEEFLEVRSKYLLY